LHYRWTVKARTLRVKSMTRCSEWQYSVIIRSQLSPAVCTVCLDYSKQNTLSSWQNSWPSVLPHWTVTRVSKSKHNIIHPLYIIVDFFFKTRKNPMEWLRAFLFSLHRIFSPCAIRGPSLTGFVYFRIPSSQLGLEWINQT